MPPTFPSFVPLRRRAARHPVFVVLAIVVLTLLVGCGGGGGSSGSATRPTLVGTVLVGTSPTPVPGDFLLLVFSEDVVPVSGRLLDGNDIDVNGGTLGTITALPTQVTARTLRVDLGTGASLTAGSTTMSMRSTNDAVQSVRGALAGPGSAVTMTVGDGDNPTVGGLTLNGIPAALNGTGPAGGTLQAPRNGFDIAFTHTDATSTIDTSRTVVAADVTVVADGAARVAGTNLAPFLTPDLSPTASSYEVPATVTFPDGLVTLSVFVFDLSGMQSSPATFGFRVRAGTAAVRPFENGQLWFVDLSRDVEDYQLNPNVVGRATQPISVIPGANARPDIEDLFVFLGLHGGNGALDANVTTRFRNDLATELATLCAGTSITFTFTSPGTFPSGVTSVPYANLGFSQIALAGSESTQGNSGVLGVAIFDPSNKFQNDNTRIDFGGTQRLGVFLHTMANVGMRPPGSSTFRLTFDPLSPSFGGTPIGGVANDDSRVAGTLTDARGTTITTAIRRFARAAAVVLAHECGHSMGLVKDGAMPTGLYGGDPVNFPNSTSGHIALSALFPAGSQEVMAPSISFDAALSSSTAFNPLNLAYLRERVIQDDN
jgi:hypothetical protein